MKKAFANKVIGLLILASVLMLAGCGQNENTTTKGVVENEARSVSNGDTTENADDNLQQENAVEDTNSTENTNSVDETNSAKQKESDSAKLEDATASIENSSNQNLDSLIGTYEYLPPDDVEERVFEIGQIGEKYYIEYMGIYDFAAGEIEFLNAVSDHAEDWVYEVIIYPYSGFSFMGEYWGAGCQCSILQSSNGDITITGEQPFILGEDLKLIRQEGISSHVAVCEAEENKECEALVGTWRCISARDDVSREITLVFDQKGIFKAESKQQDHTPMIYLGRYHVSKTADGITGDIICEAAGHGNMPYEWILEYDQEHNRPLIYDDYMCAEPFTYKEEDKNLPFQKIDGTKTQGFAPGPGARTEEVVKLYKEYMSGYAQEDEAADEEVRKLEEAIRVFPIYDHYLTSYGAKPDISKEGGLVLANWAIYEKESAAFAGLTFEMGTDKVPVGYLDDEALTEGQDAPYVRTKTDILERAMQDFFHVENSFNRPGGYIYTIDDNYVTLWGNQYKEDYNNGNTVEWVSFRHYMDGDTLVIEGVRTTEDATKKRDDTIQFLFEQNPGSFYGYSLINYDNINSEYTLKYSLDTIKGFENYIRSYVNKEAKESDKVVVKAGVDGCPYERWFYYNASTLVFAYYYGATDGSVDNRYYFMAGEMIEWIEGNGTDDSNRERHYSCDLPLDSRWRATEKQVLEEAVFYRNNR